MNLFRPLRGEVLFTCPAISNRKFESRWVKPRMAIMMPVLNILLAGTLWFFVFHTDLTAIIHLLCAFAVFASIVIPVMRAFREKHPSPHLHYLHYFYRDVVYVFDDIPRRNGRLFIAVFPDTVDRIIMREIEFKGDRFRFFTISFKDTVPGILPNFQKVKFAIPLDVDLAPVTNWLCGHGLTVKTA